MALSNAELVLLTLFDSIEQGLELPDGFDSAALVRSGLVSDGTAGWVLTEGGRLYQQQLRASSDVSVTES